MQKLRMRARVKKKKRRKTNELKAANLWASRVVGGTIQVSDLREQMWNIRQGKIFLIFIND